jgi:hypothetical protein
MESSQNKLAYICIFLFSFISTGAKAENLKKGKRRKASVAYPTLWAVDICPRIF